MTTGNMVVARFQDGKMVKGTTQDFFPNKAEFHIFQEGHEKRQALKVPVNSLKALFFVKTFEGNKGYREDKSFARAKGQGRKMEVLFKDGETLTGFAMGYNPTNVGFFLVPTDAESNNSRIYVVNEAVKSVKWA